MEQTFSMIKPDAMKRGLGEEIKAFLESRGFRIVDSKEVTLKRPDAEWLYGAHSQRDFFGDLVNFTISGPVILLCLEGDDNVVQDLRDNMGATKIGEALPGTIRHDFRNPPEMETPQTTIIHGSDSKKRAAEELAYFKEHYGLAA